MGSKSYCPRLTSYSIGRSAIECWPSCDFGRQTFWNSDNFAISTELVSKQHCRQNSIASHDSFELQTGFDVFFIAEIVEFQKTKALGRFLLLSLRLSALFDH